MIANDTKRKVVRKVGMCGILMKEVEVLRDAWMKKEERKDEELRGQERWWEARVLLTTASPLPVG